MARSVTPSPGRKSDKLWRDAINVAVHRDISKQDKKNYLAGIAEKLVLLAYAGDVSAMKEIGDRLEGKPAQAIIGGDADTPPVRILHEADKDIIARYINSRKGIE